MVHFWRRNTANQLSVSYVKMGLPRQLFVVDLKVGIHSMHEFGLEGSRRLGEKDADLMQTRDACVAYAFYHTCTDPNGMYCSKEG